MAVEGAPPPKAAGKHPHKHPSEHKQPEAQSFRLILDQKFIAPSRVRRPINNDSISPWTYTFTHDEDMYPTDIAEAKCSLTGCLNNDGEEVLDFESKPIYTQVLVLKRVKGEGKDYHFRLESKTISVGCTCVRPHIEYQ
ncbi:interleukin 17a/f1 [Chanos chanos]|uniref:Interleukin 17a/f1 n=1 Tax=Chanos chanos TaxID=29144 RepID=A0A6J2WHK8_CHACN|nr:interleukin-17F-like [Chanos chanos]